MALKSTVFKADLQVNDMDRHHYGLYPLTLARHPSETDERMMVRLLAFAFHADERLIFGKGLCDEDEPDLWKKDLTGVIEEWVEVGLPDERRLRKAAGRARAVRVYAYGARAVEVWWQANKSAFARLDNLTVYQLPSHTTEAATALVERTMQLQFNLADGEAWLGKGEVLVPIERLCLTA
ncbi:MAG: hypothetical protein RIR70_101 [Pseudomonadota bacterium]|jgi:uncharacterized protein YaeQ